MEQVDQYAIQEIVFMIQADSSKWDSHSLTCECERIVLD